MSGYRGGMERRDRHGRGLRGPLSLPNEFTDARIRGPQQSRGPDFFADCIRSSVARLQRCCPRALTGVDLGFEDIPPAVPGWSGRVPLAAATTAGPQAGARLVLYRRPLEHRAQGRRDLARLVHRTVVEQLSALTGIPTEEIDPDLSQD